MVGRKRKKKKMRRQNISGHKYTRTGSRTESQQAKRKEGDAMAEGGHGRRRTSNGGGGHRRQAETKSKGRRAGEDEASNQFVVELPPRLALDLLTPTESLERPDARFSLKRRQKKGAHEREAHLEERRERGPRDVWRERVRQRAEKPSSDGRRSDQNGAALDNRLMLSSQAPVTPAGF